MAPYKPVSSALGILGLLDIMSPLIDCSRHRDTGYASNVTPKPDNPNAGDDVDEADGSSQIAVFEPYPDS
jgi:hypothetical protein